MDGSEPDRYKRRSATRGDEHLVSKDTRSSVLPTSEARSKRVLETGVPFHRIKRTIRRTELREIVPLADTTIYELEQRGEFPRRFYLTSRCVVWDLAEVEAWIEDRRRASDRGSIKRAPSPDVRQRRVRPVRQ